MSVDSRRIIDEVTKTSIELLLKEPFYSHFFSALNKEVVSIDHAVQTLAVGLAERNHVLYINPLFWSEILIDPKHRYGVVKHEILHIVFKHTLVKPDKLNKHLINIAMDIVVNQYIERHHLPEFGIFLEDFPELELSKDQSWKYYYDRLLDLSQQLDGKYKGTKAAESLMSIEESSHGLDRHVLWEKIYDQSKTERELLDTSINGLVILANQKTPVKSLGLLPGAVRLHLQTILLKVKPLVDWRRVIKLFSESSCKTKVVNTLRRPSKRFGTNPGVKIKKLKKLLVAIDTSGSIRKSELSEFFREIYHIWKQGAEIEIVECDSKIQRTYSYKGVAPEFVLGRGGTEFDPVLTFANTIFKPDGIIYFTDGVAFAPSVKSRAPLLWVISKNGIPADSELFAKLPGRKAILN